MPKSKPLRIAVEGATTDGRNIERSWIEQMVASYDKSKFGARINLEHIRGILPDSPFKAYGDVIALSSEEIVIDGKKKLALLGTLDATDELVAMNKARQKVYTSIEIDPNFAKSGQAYLVGLAVTDSPASLGTEMLAFAAKAKINPLAERKQHPENLFTESTEAAIEWEDESPSADNTGATLFSKVKELLGIKGKTDEAKFADIGQAVEAIAIAQKDLLEKFASASVDLKKTADMLAAATTAATADRQTFAEFKTVYDAQPDGTGKRPSAAGGSAGGQVTDC